MSDMRSSRVANFVDSLFFGLGRGVVLLVPSAFLTVAAIRSWDQQKPWLLLGGIAFQLLVMLWTFLSARSWNQPIGPALVTLYLTAVAWLWFGDGVNDWFTHLSKGVLIGFPIIVFGFQTLIESGAPMLRDANILADRLSNRQDWPADLLQCRVLPEVKAFRASLAYDAAPALALLDHPRIEVRVAALLALEFRKDWRPGQAEYVMQIAQRAEEPVVRAAAVLALGNLEDRQMIEALAQFLNDPSQEVRRAAIEALLWEGENCWAWIRFAIRRNMSDPLFRDDGPLLPEGQLLIPEMVNDMTAWCAEKGQISARAAETLAAHFNRLMCERIDPTLVAWIRQQLADPQTPAVLRVELGRLMQVHKILDDELLDQMLDPGTPATLRLIACETILSQETGDPMLRSVAVSCLKDLARLPNREIALGTADVVQRRLGVDLGIGLGQPLPPVNSRQAGDVVRRLLAWANQGDDELEQSGAPRGGSRWTI
ncbi:MAG: HEAT repeat domain-containing protein [Planctomycetes bacterium]|nr:HEAT repeat domain-containing protein [Planctomycetota bacterium]